MMYKKPSRKTKVTAAEFDRACDQGKGFEALDLETATVRAPMQRINTERVTLVVLGAFALVGLGLLAWLQQRPPLTIGGSPSPAHAARWDEALQRAKRVDVNAATVAELERLPQVGPMLARRIVAYRQRHGRFRTPELGQVEGIGPKTSGALADYVTTGQ